MYGLDGTIRAVPFDLERLAVTGVPVPVLDGVITKTSGAADFSLSETRSLVYVPTGATARRTLGWVDRDGQMTTSVIEENTAISTPRLSPDGTRVAFAGARGVTGVPDIWIRELERGSDTRLTVEGINIFPAWTPDGATVTFTSDRSGAFDLYSKLADLSGEAEQLVTSAAPKFAGSWSPDGQVLVYTDGGFTTLRDIWALPVGGDPAPFLVTDFDERAPRLSPDGQWVAYVSDQSGEDRVYVQRFPEGGGVSPISTEGETEPVWSRDDRELFYRNGTQMLVVVGWRRRQR